MKTNITIKTVLRYSAASFLFSGTVLFYVFIYAANHVSISDIPLAQEHGEAEFIKFSYSKRRKANYVEGERQKSMYDQGYDAVKYLVTEVPSTLFKNTRVFKRPSIISVTTNTNSFKIQYPDFYNKILYLRGRSYSSAVKAYNNIPEKIRMFLIEQEFSTLSGRPVFHANLAIFLGEVMTKDDILFLSKLMQLCHDHITSYYLSEAIYKIRFPEKRYVPNEEIRQYDETLREKTNQPIGKNIEDGLK
jgi:hypothetical protein